MLVAKTLAAQTKMESVVKAAIPRFYSSRHSGSSCVRVRLRSVHQRNVTRGALSSDRLQRQTREAVIKAINRAPDQRVTPGDAAAASGLPLSDAEVFNLYGFFLLFFFKKKKKNKSKKQVSEYDETIYRFPISNRLHSRLWPRIRMHQCKSRTVVTLFMHSKEILRRSSRPIVLGNFLRVVDTDHFDV